MQADRRFYNLDGMRGVAALLVILYHFVNIGPVLAPRGYIAVDFFFILSGFVIDRAYGSRIGNTMSRSTFIKLRLIRLYPLFVVGIALGLIKAIAQIATSDPDAKAPSFVLTSMLNFFAIPVFGEKTLYFLNGPAWSLALEFVINIAYVFWLAKATSKSVLIATLVGAAGVVFYIYFEGNADFGWSVANFPGGLFRVFFGFGVGVLLSRHVKIPKTSTWLSVLIPLVLVAALCLPKVDGANVAVDIALVLVICPALILGGILMELPEQLKKAGAFLGDVSYPLYITHYPLLFMFVFVAHKLGLNGIPMELAFLICMIVGAKLLEMVYDHPVRAALTRSYSGSPRVAQR